jgi:hypothetical protein
MEFVNNQNRIRIELLFAMSGGRTTLIIERDNDNRKRLRIGWEGEEGT